MSSAIVVIIDVFHIILILTILPLKISRVVGIIARVRHSVPLNTLIQINPSLILLFTFYGIAAWCKLRRLNCERYLSYRNVPFGYCSLLVKDLMLSPFLSLLTSYLSICFILKRFLFLRMTFLLILRLGTDLSPLYLLE